MRLGAGGVVGYLFLSALMLTVTGGILAMFVATNTLLTNSWSPVTAMSTLTTIIGLTFILIVIATSESTARVRRRWGGLLNGALVFMLVFLWAQFFVLGFQTSISSVLDRLLLYFAALNTAILVAAYTLRRTRGWRGMLTN